jgi:hypothetical protein
MPEYVPDVAGVCKYISALPELVIAFKAVEVLATLAIIPLACNLTIGEVVPIPTLPLVSTYNADELLMLTCNGDVDALELMLNVPLLFQLGPPVVRLDGATAPCPI